MWPPFHTKILKLTHSGREWQFIKCAKPEQDDNQKMTDNRFAPCFPQDECWVEVYLLRVHWLDMLQGTLRENGAPSGRKSFILSSLFRCFCREKAKYIQNTDWMNTRSKQQQQLSVRIVTKLVIDWRAIEVIGWESMDSRREINGWYQRCLCTDFLIKHLW